MIGEEFRKDEFNVFIEDSVSKTELSKGLLASAGRLSSLGKVFPSFVMFTFVIFYTKIK